MTVTRRTLTLDSRVASAEVEPLASGQVVGTLPVTVDLVLYRGDDFYLDVNVTDSLGAPFDLTGYTATSQIRETYDGDPLASFTATITGSVIHLHLPSASSAEVTMTGVWDVQMADTAGAVTTLAHGVVSVTPDVTRD